MRAGDFWSAVLPALPTTCAASMSSSQPLDLFGDAPEQFNKPQGGKHYVAPAGYVYMPGTGPKGQQCGTCKHMTRGGSWHKCELNRGKWTSSRKTDVLVRAPACAKWEDVTGNS